MLNSYSFIFLWSQKRERGEGLTSIRKRLDNVLNELSNLGREPDEKACGNIAAELAIIRGAFKESYQFPVCCFTYDANGKVICDMNGPFAIEEFMNKCRLCQAQIKEILTIL